MNVRTADGRLVPLISGATGATLGPDDYPKPAAHCSWDEAKIPTYDAAMAFREVMDERQARQERRLARQERHSA